MSPLNGVMESLGQESSAQGPRHKSLTLITFKDSRDISITIISEASFLPIQRLHQYLTAYAIIHATLRRMAPIHQKLCCSCGLAIIFITEIPSKVAIE